MAIDLGVQSPSSMVIPILNNRFHVIFSGRLVGRNNTPLLKGVGSNWNRGIFTFWVPTRFTHIEQITASAQLASISNDRTATNAGWAVDFIAPKPNVVGTNRLIQIDVGLAVRDSDGFVNGIDYQINAVGT